MTEDAGEGINMTSRAGDFTEKEWHDYSENVALEVGERRGRGPWEADSAEERHGEESAGDPRRQRRPSDSPWEAGEGARPSPPPRPPRELGGWESFEPHTVWCFLARMARRLPQFRSHRKTRRKEQ